MARPPASEQVQVNFRMPADLKARIEAAAEANSRTTTAELVAALEEKYPAPKKPSVLDMMLEILDRKYEGSPPEAFEQSQKAKAYLLNAPREEAERVARAMAEEFFRTFQETGEPPPLSKRTTPTPTDD